MSTFQMPDIQKIIINIQKQFKIQNILSSSTMRYLSYILAIITLFLVTKFYDEIVALGKKQITMDELFNRLKSSSLIELINKYGLIILILLIIIITVGLNKMPLQTFVMSSMFSLLILSLFNQWDITRETSIYYDTNNLTGDVKSYVRYAISLLTIISFFATPNYVLNGINILLLLASLLYVHMNKEISKFSFWPIELLSMVTLQDSTMIVKMGGLIRLIYTLPYTNLKLFS